MSEFDLIAKYFTWENLPRPSANHTSHIIKSVGDDAAVLSLAANRELVTSIDTLVAGVHFPLNTKAFDIAYKALAVNLSDLAAMGARPEWFTLALTLPEIKPHWLSEFSHGLKSLAKEANIALVGGDTCSGPLSISIQVMGSVETGKALYRSGAKLNDCIYVTGTLGDGAAGLSSIKGELTLAKEHANFCQQRLNRPTARLSESQFLSVFASAAIDVSDGLLQDLSHILEQSADANGAKLDLSTLPLSQALQSINAAKALEFALNGGDDYELLFTLPKALEPQFLSQSKASGFQFTCIGAITADEGICDVNHSQIRSKGYNHFNE